MLSRAAPRYVPSAIGRLPFARRGVLKSICLVYPVENEMNAMSKKEADAGVEGPMARRRSIELRPIKELHL